MAKLLIVEDDTFFQTYLTKTLTSHFEIVVAKDLPEAQEEISKNEFDLFLVDVILPSGSGLNLCAYIRNQEALSHKPVLILSSKDEIEDVVKGLEFGADDYIKKPCHPQELIARIKAHLRKLEGSSKMAPLLEVEGYKIDFLKQRVFDPKGKVIVLTHLEFKLLHFFARHLDHVLSRAQILEAVWPENLNITERVVDTHISNLRKKLGPLGQQFRSVHSSGYCLSTRLVA